MMRAEFNQKTRRLEPVGLITKKRTRAKFSFVIGKTSSQTFEQFNRHMTQRPPNDGQAEIVRDLEELSAVATRPEPLELIESAFDTADYVAFCDLFGDLV